MLINTITALKAQAIPNNKAKYPNNKEGMGAGETLLQYQAEPKNQIRARVSSRSPGLRQMPFQNFFKPNSITRLAPIGWYAL